MEKYKAYIEHLANNRINENFINSDEVHALQVLIQIFEHSQKTIRIFASNLCSSVPNKPEYILTISDFIERGGELRILLNAYDSSSALTSALMKRLAYFKLNGRKISLKQTDAKPYYASDPIKSEIHFTIGDSDAYRIETNIETRTADCNFNNPTLATKYVTFFDTLYDKPDSKDIDLMSLFNLSSSDANQ